MNKPKTPKNPNKIVSACWQKLQQEGLSIYALTKQLKGEVSKTAVYDFFDNKPTTVPVMMAILKTCGLTIEIKPWTIRVLKALWRDWDILKQNVPDTPPPIAESPKSD